MTSCVFCRAFTHRHDTCSFNSFYLSQNLHCFSNIDECDPEQKIFGEDWMPLFFLYFPASIRFLLDLSPKLFYDNEKIKTSRECDLCMFPLMSEIWSIFQGIASKLMFKIPQKSILVRTDRTNYDEKLVRSSLASLCSVSNSRESSSFGALISNVSILSLSMRLECSSAIWRKVSRRSGWLRSSENVLDPSGAGATTDGGQQILDSSATSKVMAGFFTPCREFGITEFAISRLWFSRSDLEHFL